MDDHRIADAKRKGMAAIMQQLDITGLKRGGVEWTGPCPNCGGTDRFSINTRKSQFLCRQCGGKGDEIGLVQFIMGLDFIGALEWICGPKQQLSEAEIAKRAARDAENKARKEREAKAYHDKAVREGREIWEAGRPAEDSPVRDYLALRGITRDLFPKLPVCLRFHPALPYMLPNPDRGSRNQWIEIYRGPAMLAAVQGMNDRFCAVHRTWFDLDQPQGKARIPDPVTGEPLKRKKGYGAKKGGAIRLHNGAANNRTLVMAEGIETTLSALIADAYPGAHYWAGVDLGNMSGQRITGRGLKYAGIPDLEDAEAFLPPPWVDRLIFVKDGDSDPRDTQAKLEAGIRRAMVNRPGLRGQIVACPDGKDLNDVLLDGDGDE
ncbi:hypothetical protein GCM10010873_26760 [Cypionkella aquatica]|uniref:DNA primase/helicase Gp4 N-terminal Bacteriophage T7-like domain-containing protein n=1 Tax=Cypionkella aquatica TaxID=1756042 RepID=A0AA37U0V0_9RHOB|nr:primase-helicase zinc-binding domain-containing protein [Cypionkella aquatica]GLS87702.1 hypothetical protein GCM10010873_26760 [Cypionkella aquatica]